MNKIKVELIHFADARHMEYIVVNLCGLYYYTDFDTGRTIQEPELYEFFTIMLDIDPEDVLKEQQEFGFNPHEIILSEEWDLGYYNHAGVLTYVYEQ